MAYETVTKLEVAERQLRAAIRLFFEDADLIAVHTLAAAAQQVLYDLGKSRGVVSIFKDNPLVRPEKRQEIKKLFSAAENFFKHADRDPDAQLKFYYEATKFYLLDAASLYFHLTKRQFPELVVLQIWFALKFPDLLEAWQKDLIAKRAPHIDPDDHQGLLELIDRPPSLEYLRDRGDPVLQAFVDAPQDDEPLSSEDEAALAEAEEELREGAGVPWDQVPRSILQKQT